MVGRSLAQDVGFPVPRGGAGRLTDALVARLRHRGGRVVTGHRIDEVVVDGGRAVGVRGPDGLAVRARRAVLADVGAPQLYLDLLDPMRAGADLRGRIVEVRPETADAATVVIRPGRGWRGHVPGQYVRIGVDIDGVRHWRAYSLTHRADGSSAAGIPAGCIAITTKAIPEGKVSTHLVRRARPGTLVMLDQATGEFTLPAPAPAKVNGANGHAPRTELVSERPLATPATP